MNLRARAALAMLILGLAGIQPGARAQEAPLLMSVPWGALACTAWNADPVLTLGLAESGWSKNDKGRGYKVIHFYRADCAESPRVELRIAHKEDKASCVYGGAVQADTKLDDDVDYLMWADTRRWVEMGAGEYGPMRAMMFRRLHFEGPMGEAMGNMGPFENFLLLVGKVKSDPAACPK